ncbi:MAG: ester cyclase [Gemmatimonadota bacterium]|nr:ester cyclase [Gemmatimonadota bacterium]
MRLDDTARDFKVIRTTAPTPPVGARKLLADRAIRTRVLERDVTPAAVPVFADSRPWSDDYLRALEDPRIEWKESIAAGEYRVSKYRVSGTHVAPLLGVAPTGKQVQFDMYSARATNPDGSVDLWSTFDSAGLMRQLTRTQSD